MLRIGLSNILKPKPQKIKFLTVCVHLMQWGWNILHLASPFSFQNSINYFIFQVQKSKIIIKDGIRKLVVTVKFRVAATRFQHLKKLLKYNKRTTLNSLNWRRLTYHFFKNKLNWAIFSFLQAIVPDDGFASNVSKTAFDIYIKI